MKLYCGSRLIWDKIALAANPYARFHGLMGRRALLEGEGLLIIPCNQVHTFHMRFSLDILFVTKELRIAKIITIEPGKVGPRVKEAAFVVEMAAGSAQQMQLSSGDVITIDWDGEKRRI